MQKYLKAKKIESRKINNLVFRGYSMKVNMGFFVSKFLRLINRPALRNCTIDRTAKIGTGSNCIGVTMGRYSYMGKNNSVCNASIGSFCSIASYCAIGGGEHEMTSVSTSPVFAPGRNVFGFTFAPEGTRHVSKQVQIGHDVWIGEKVFIKAGISIGDGAVIGAHSVVTHDVPAYAIVAGTPAKPLRYRFSEEEQKLLQESKWWEWDEETLKKKGHLFSSVEGILKA